VYVIKRDIANYFPSVTHSILLGLLEQWVDKQDYLYTLVEQRKHGSQRHGAHCSFAGWHVNRM